MVNIATLEFRHVIPESYFQGEREKPEFWSRLPFLLNHIARKVREDWDSFSPEEKEALINFYYLLIGEGKIPIINRITGLLHILKLRISYGSSFICTLNDALSNLKYALTDIVENSNPQYLRDLGEALKNIHKKEKEITSESLDEWFEKVDD